MTENRISYRIGAGRLIVAKGDITAYAGDAIVNAANSALVGGGGVDGAIHRAAGSKLLDACQDIVRERGPLPPGQAVITPGFGLSAKFVIHTVGPIWRGGKANEPNVLQNAYMSSLRLAAANQAATLAFPAVSCGAYGFPLELAAPIALAAIADGLKEELAAHVSLILYSATTFQAFAAQARAMFGDPAGDDGAGLF
jgi:O-acetyl-ADP-ribose deacetylase (regulator of RNase III)